MKTIPFLTLGAWLVTASVWADDLAKEQLHNWHQWRGPLANGVAPHGDPPVHWDSQTNVKWQVAVPGRGSSTPIVWQDQVFVLTAIPTDRAADANALPKPDRPSEKKTT